MLFKLSVSVGLLLVGANLSAANLDLQSRIDAVAKSGGGRVSVPSGTWTVGALTLSSGVELHLEEGARLVFSDDPALYEGKSALVSAIGATNVSITGGGTFEAKVDYWHKVAHKKHILRPRFFRFADCGNVRLEGFKVRNSPNWTIHMLCTDDVTIRGLDMRCEGGGCRAERTRIS